MTRRAIVTGGIGTPTLEQIQRYMPANYTARTNDNGQIEIEGEDNAGWTLDGYVIPRLESGWYVVKEV